MLHAKLTDGTQQVQCVLSVDFSVCPRATGEGPCGREKQGRIAGCHCRAVSITAGQSVAVPLVTPWFVRETKSCEFHLLLGSGEQLQPPAITAFLNMDSSFRAALEDLATHCA